VGGDDAEGDVFLAGALDRPRRACPTRVCVEQHRDDHRRLERSAAVTVGAISGVERVEVHLRDGVDDKPREVPLGQPLADVRRQQERLLAIGREKVLAHHRMVLTAPDGAPFVQQPPWKGERRAGPYRGAHGWSRISRMAERDGACNCLLRCRLRVGYFHARTKGHRVTAADTRRHPFRCPLQRDREGSPSVEAQQPSTLVRRCTVFAVSGIESLWCSPWTLRLCRQR
jgi:hypothetical protein